MTDISTIVSNNSQLDLLEPNSQKELGLRLEILPPDSIQIKEAARKIRDKQKLLAQKGRPPMSADEERAAKEVCMIAVVGWEWTAEDASWSGQQPTFNKTVLADMIERDWLRSQIDTHLGDIKNFF